MAKLICVYSTLTADNRYVDWKPGAGKGAPPVEGESVLVKGGAGLSRGEAIATPRGVATMVTPQQAELLKRNDHFKEHMKRGFVSIEEVDRPPTQDAADNAAANMEGRDGSAPLVPQDFTLNGQTPPKVG